MFSILEAIATVHEAQSHPTVFELASAPSQDTSLAPSPRGGISAASTPRVLRSSAHRAGERLTMSKASRNCFWVAASAAAPVALTPTMAWAASDSAIVVGSAISGVVGAAVGAGVAGGLGYRALRREREAHEELLYGRSEAPAPAPAPAPVARPTRHHASSKHPASPRVAPGHAALGSADAGDPAAAYGGYVSDHNPYLKALDDTRDLDQVAVDYVAGKSLKTRMTQRAKGVAQVLSERMGKNFMDGMPVITRADGSVGDLGTSWWDPAMSGAFAAQPQALRYVSAPASARPALAAQAPAPAAQAPATARPEPARPRNLAAILPGSDLGAQATPAPRPAAPDLTISRIIASRVAPIEQEAYPEIDRSWSPRDDHWERALAALDERVEDNLMGERLDRAYRRLEQSRPAAAFGDGIGTAETLDEPDGLERDTQFLSFKAPGNHPEVQDTASYINYLIGDEFRRNPSRQARRQARSYLKLHEGGTHAQAKAVV